jgi:ethanolamine ammonia-lyase large subunit
MAANEDDVLAYVARMMGISRVKASELTGLANDAVAEVLDPEHIIDQSPDRDAVLELEEDQVDVQAIAERLQVPVAEFRSWIEDEMIFIAYGANLSEGLARKDRPRYRPPLTFIAAGTMT